MLGGIYSQGRGLTARTGPQGMSHVDKRAQASRGPACQQKQSWSKSDNIPQANIHPVAPGLSLRDQSPRARRPVTPTIRLAPKLPLWQSKIKKASDRLRNLSPGEACLQSWPLWASTTYIPSAFPPLPDNVCSSVSKRNTCCTLERMPRRGWPHGQDLRKTNKPWTPSVHCSP